MCGFVNVKHYRLNSVQPSASWLARACVKNEMLKNKTKQKTKQKQKTKKQN